ncbi:hypothetical protein BsWGS_03918 [Bradybaena similaris]
MKYSIIAICITLLAMHSMLIVAGHRRNRVSTTVSPKTLRVRNVVDKELSEKCSQTIKKYGRESNSDERNCKLLKTYHNFLEKKGECTPEDFDKLNGVLECDGADTGAEFQEQQDATDATPGEASATERIASATERIASATERNASKNSSASKGPQKAGNVTTATP